MAVREDFTLNLKVLILDTDFYARHKISSYLARDRRTRVVHLADSLDSVIEYLDRSIKPEWPDVVLLDAQATDDRNELAGLVKHIEDRIKDVMTLVLDRKFSRETAHAIEEARVNGYLLRQEVNVCVASLICWAQGRDFVVTRTIKSNLKDEFKRRLKYAEVVPPRREYRELTDRIRETLEYAVVEGMSAELVADEMSISQNTVRSYVRDGYRILEDHDKDSLRYTHNMSPSERAYIRLTALETD